MVRTVGRQVEEATFERVLTTMLFTDVVGSTEKAAAIGDGAWKTLVERHHATVRAMIGRYRGNEVDTAGDGFFATFDGPAWWCAARRRSFRLFSRSASTSERVFIRARWRSSITRSAIVLNIGARVAGRAQPAEVLVSQTVRDLTAGSELVFEDAGEHELKVCPTPTPLPGGALAGRDSSSPRWSSRVEWEVASTTSEIWIRCSTTLALCARYHVRLV